MRVLVTGGAGFIGANLVRKLERIGWDVVVLDDLSNSDTSRLLATSANLIKGSVSDQGALEIALQGADAVVHLAALTSVSQSVEMPEECHERNVTASLKLLEAARSHNAYIVLASSAAVYGSKQKLPISENAETIPTSPYGASKLAMEHYTSTYARIFGVRSMLLRFFNVFGPFQEPLRSGAMVPNFITAALRDRPVSIYGDGSQTRDLVPVSYVCSVIERALARSVVTQKPVNVASGRSCTARQVVTAIGEALGVVPAMRHLPARPGDVPHSLADVRRLRQLFPDLGEINFRRELEDTISWFEYARV